MNAFGASPFASSPHRDVLEAPVPVDGVSQLVLLGELKNRGRAAVQGSQYPDAVALYEKALHVTQDPKEKSVLEANLSLCHQKMMYWSGAVETAERSTEHDPSYVKGWWRLGQAHAGATNYAKAVSAMERACQLEPSNKAIKKECEKFQQLLRSNPSAAAPQQSSATATATATASASAAASAPAPAKSKPSPSPSKASGTSNSDAQSTNVTGDDDGFTASDVVRGYKVVNGKKTSYFHNELSSDAAKLIGDIAPKKLDVSAADSGSAANAAAAGTGPGDSTSIVSAWNKAGTWEERDVTKWALETLQQRLGACQHNWESFRASVSKCDVKGHASVAMVRGKKRYIYEFEIHMDWEVVTTTESDSTPLAAGKLSFPEIDGTCSGVYEATASVSSLLPPLDRTEVDRNVCKKGLRDVLHTSLNDWIEQLKETY